MKILVDEDIPYAKALFRHLGDVQTISGRSISASSLVQIDALIVRSITRVDSELLGNSQVKFVGTVTAGTDHIDQNWLSNAGIIFSAASGCNAIAVVEYVFSALLFLAQRDGFLLSDKTIGIIGSGNVGSRLYLRMKALNVRTLLCDPPLNIAGVPGDWQPLEKLVEEADILTLHTPLTYTGQYATWHLIDEQFLAALPNRRILINTCRGSVVDNVALLKVLERGKLLNVVLDVWEPEPELSLPLLAKVDIGTAHIAGYTLESKIRSVTQIFNTYSALLGNEVRANLPSLPIKKHIRLQNGVNEKTLFSLANSIYNVQRDDMKLRHIADQPGAFDHLRKTYFPRREWSSICIESNSREVIERLIQLGFYARAY